MYLHTNTHKTCVLFRAQKKTDTFSLFTSTAKRANKRKTPHTHTHRHIRKYTHAQGGKERANKCQVCKYKGQHSTHSRVYTHAHAHKHPPKHTRTHVTWHGDAQSTAGQCTRALFEKTSGGDTTPNTHTHMHMNNTHMHTMYHKHTHTPKCAQNKCNDRSQTHVRHAVCSCVHRLFQGCA
eukprot:GDKI01041767.1.p3 GENE.GDKI01041767.1~~GDKI01041767.1.p3  ORF type:complete len:180 (+),score=56.48 GDKI01041767.1:346-885(+)